MTRHKISLRMKQGGIDAVAIFDIDLTWLAVDAHMDMATFEPALATLREFIISCEDGSIMRQSIPPAEDDR